jgi:uncharacterized protein (TIGR00369 family)
VLTDPHTPYVTKELAMFTNETAPPAAVLLSREIISVNRVAGEGVFRYVARPDFTNRHGTVQGGFLAAMIDSATALTLVSCLGAGESAVTQSLTVEFLRPAKPGVIHARTRVVTRTGPTAQVAGELVDENGVTVATAVAMLRVLKSKTSD